MARGSTESVNGRHESFDPQIPASLALAETEAECEALAAAILRALREHVRALACWIAVAEDDALPLVVADGDAGCIAAFRDHPEQRAGEARRGGPADRALADMAPVRVEAAALHHAPWREAMARCGATQLFAAPYVAGPGRRIVVCAALPSGHEVSPEGFAAAAGRVAALHARIARQRLRLLLERGLAASGLGVFLTDRDARILWINDAALAMSGYADRQALGATPRTFHSGRQPRAYYRRFWDTILSGRFWSEDIVERRADGDLYVVHQTVSPIRDDGRVTHFLATHEDVTARRARERRLLEAIGEDPVTGLPNRAAWPALYRRRAAAAGRVLVGYVALRGLAEARGQLREQRADELLWLIARHLQEHLPPDTALLHLGDGAFALLADVAAGEQALRNALSAAAAELRERDDLPIRPALRFGCVQGSPQDDPEQLLVAADDAAEPLDL